MFARVRTLRHSVARDYSSMLLSDKQMYAALKHYPHLEKQPPSIHATVGNFLERMCAALRREPHFEKEPPSILETAGNF